MRSRILPPEEWPKLDGTEAGPAWRQFNPENTRVLVVEDGEEIVACWAFLRVVHAECIWVKHSHRGLVSVARRLFKGLREIATGWGVSRVVTGSVSPEVTDLIDRCGGYPMPCESFVLPVDIQNTRALKDEVRGKLFHEQLAALVPEDQHPEDVEHDRNVGKALRIAIERKDPERAEREYNAWASGAGYEPVRFLGEVNGRLRADIRTAVIEVDEHYDVRVLKEEVCLS